MRKKFLLMTFLLAIVGFCGTSLSAQTNVAKVGDTEYASVIAAIQAAIEQKVSEVTLLENSSEVMPTDVEFLLKADLKITANSPVTAEFYNNGTSYDFIFNSYENGGHTLTIGENVTFNLKDRIIWAGYYGDNITVVVEGTLIGGYQYWCGAKTKVTETGTLKSAGEALVLRRGTTLEVDGGKIEANYFSFLSGKVIAKNNATITSGPIWVSNGGSYANEGNVELTLDNSTWTSSGNIKLTSTHDNGVVLNVQNGAKLSASSKEHGASEIGSSAVVNVDNAVLNVGTQVTNNGEINATNGAIISTPKDVTIEGNVNVDEYSSILPQGTVAKIGTQSFETFADALTAANGMTGDVTVEIYEKVEYADATPNLTGAYDKISFVGKTDNAEISITRNGQNGYISGGVNDCNVSFTDLILSKPAGYYANDAGNMNNAFTVYRVGSVSYTNCSFPNGACAAGCPTSYIECTFNKSHDKYAVWAYGSSDINIDNCEFDDDRGIKMYAEGAAKTTVVTVTNCDFSKLTGKPAIVATLGKSITLSGNTYSDKGVLELEDNGSSNGIEITSTDAVTCISDAYPNGCGVLVNNKIYRTVTEAASVATPGSTVTLLHNSTETVTLPVGVTLDTNGYTADGVTEAAPVEVATYDELVAALANGGKITLTADITVDTKITAEKDGTVIDLNDKTLYVNVENSCYNNVTIKNGNIVLGKDDVHVCDGYFEVNAGKTLELNDVNVSSSAEGIKGYAVFHLKTGANLDLINSTLNIADNEYAAGYIVYAGEATATVDVVGTTITGSKVNGIVHATTVIDESTVTLTNVIEHGINRSGVTIDDSNVTISGGTGRGITAQHGPLNITGNSVVSISEMGEATIELRNNQNLTVAETATVTVDAAVNNTTSGTITGNVTVDASVGKVAKIGDTYYKSLQAAINAAVDGDVITLVADITEDVKITQKADLDLVINGQKDENSNYTFTGVMTVFGDARHDGNETLTIKDIDFVAKNGSDACILSPDRTAQNPARYSYSHNVTVDNCTFTDPDGNVNCAAIRHGDGGDVNWTLNKCTVDNTMHSLIQTNNVKGKLVIAECTVNSKNGVNLNSCTNVEMTGCNFDVQGYALRSGVTKGGNLGDDKTFVLNNNTLKSACDDGDAVIMFRASSVDANFTMEENIVSGTTHISGNTTDTNISAEANYWDGKNSPVVSGTPIEVRTYYAELDENGTLKNAELSDNAVAVVGEGESQQRYYTLAEAVAAAQDEGVIEIIKEGNYTLPEFAGKELTFKGSLGTSITDWVNKGSQGMMGSTVHFEGLTISGQTENYYGLFHTNAVTYKNCNINGLRFLYATEGVSFDGCAFNAEGVEHSFWTYGASNVTVNNCTFTYKDRAVNCYSENGENHELDITFTDCIFTYNGSADAPEGAVEINSGSVKSIDLVMNGCTAPEKGDMWFNSKWDSKEGVNTVVIIDGTVVWTAPVKIGDTKYTTLAEAITAVGAGDVVIELLANATLDYNARDAYGTAETTSLTINGNGNTLTLNQKNSDWSSFGLANANAKVVFNDMIIEKTGYGDTSGAWNTHAIIFSSNVEMNDVTVNNSMAVQGGATLNNLTINEAGNYYGLWVNGNGQIVTMNDGAIIAENGRGIKIADQYIDTPAKVNLTVEGTTFNTAKKAAILVTSTAGAAITATNVNIEDVVADSENIAWVDEERAANYGEVTINEEQAYMEGGTDKYDAAIMMNEDKVQGYYLTLKEALNAANNNTVTLLDNITIDTETYTIADGNSVTLDMNEKKITVTDNKTSNYELFYIYGEMTVIGDGTIELTSTHNREWNAMSAIFHNRGGVLTIENGTFKNLGGTDMAWAIDNSGNYYGDAITNIEGGEFTSTYTAIRNRMEQNSHGASGTAILNISGGKIDGTTSAIWAQAASTSTTAPATGEINITGGEVGLINTARHAGAESMTTITGGTVAAFKGESGELRVVAPGTITGDIIIMTAAGEQVEYYAITQDGLYLTAVAKVGETLYATVTEAINAAENGGTVQLLALTIDEYVAPWATDTQHTSEKSITIIGAENFGTTMTGGLYLGYDNSQCREHTIVVKGINFTGKGILVASQQNVIVEGNKFTDITDYVASSSSADKNAISISGNDVIATVKNNVITTTASVGIDLRNILTATVDGNTVTGTQHNSMQIQNASANSSAEIANNRFFDWGKSGEGRAMRINQIVTADVNNNVMINVNAPEEFVKITGHTTAKIDENYWNGANPTSSNTPAYFLAEGVQVHNYYAAYDAESNTLSDLVTIEGAGETLEIFYTAAGEVTEQANAAYSLMFTVTDYASKEVSVKIGNKTPAQNSAIHLETPETVEFDNVEFDVTSVANNGFNGTRFKTIKISEGVRTLGTKALANMYDLTSVVFPQTLVSVGDNCFHGYGDSHKIKSITSYAVEAPNASGNWQTVPFQQCIADVAVLIVPNALSYTEYKESAGWSRFKNIIGVGSTKEIAGEDDKYTLLATVTSMNPMESSIQIGNTKPASNSNAELVLPEVVDYFPSVEGLDFTVTSIPNNAFSTCYNFTGDLEIPATVKTIGNSAFLQAYYNTLNVGKLTLNEGLETILNSAFTLSYFDNENLVIPTTVTTIGSHAFNATNMSGTLTVQKNIPGGFSGFAGSLFTMVVVEEGVTSIVDSGSKGVFSKMSKLETVILPSTLEEIGVAAFSEDYAITTIITSATAQVPAIENTNAFDASVKTNATVWVVGNSYDDVLAYKANAKWNEFANIHLYGAVAQIGEVEYLTIQEAIAAATSGQTITLLADVEAADGNPVLIPEGVTLDINTHNVTANIYGTVKTSGGLWTTEVPGFNSRQMLGNGAIYNTTDATVANSASEVKMLAGSIVLNPNPETEWWTLPNQNLSIASGASFEVPANIKFTVRENTHVVVDGTLTVNGVVYLQMGATVKAAADLNILTDVEGYMVSYENGVYSVVQAIYTQTTQLIAGWNWFSYYVNTDLETLENELGESAAQIKSHKQGFDTYAGPETWIGSLNEILPEQMYMINANVPSTLNLKGEIIDHENVEITLVKNAWNWIGYPINGSVNLSDAFNGEGITIGDQIKSHNHGFAYYAGNNTWIGELQVLVKGEGYMYHNTSDENVVFTYNVPQGKSNSELKSNITSENNYWTPNASQYPNNMTMTAMVDIEGGDYEVAAFVDGEVRGSARPIYVESIDAYVLFLTIHGEGVEEMTFKFYDLTTGEEFDLNDRMNYSDDAIVGSLKEPYMFNRGTTGIGEAAMSEVNIYPNPTTTGTEINLQATCDKVEVFNALGVKVAEYQNVDSIDALETAGIYVIRLTNNGNVKHCSLVVK